MPSTVPGAGNAAVNKTKSLPPMGSVIVGRDGGQPADEGQRVG